MHWLALSVLLSTISGTVDAPVSRDDKFSQVVTVAQKSDVKWYERVRLFGFIRVGLFYTFPFRDEELLGSRGGFRLINVRLGVEATPVDKLRVVVSLDGAVGKPLVDDPLTGSQIVELRDAFAEYSVRDWLNIRAGQFRPPYFAEMLLGDSHVPFIQRSVVSRGMAPPEAYGPREGIVLDRQIGLEVYSKRIGSGPVGFRYAVAAVNGNGLNQLLNDNNIVSPVARVELDIFDKVAIAANAFYNPQTFGVRPNRLTANHIGYGVDLFVHHAGFEFLGAFVGRRTLYSYGALPADNGFGGVVSLTYMHTASGFGGGVRFALLDPSSGMNDDFVMETTAMIQWQVPSTPMRFVLQYTNRTEQSGVSTPNDSVDAMIAVNW